MSSLGPGVQERRDDAKLHPGAAVRRVPGVDRRRARRAGVRVNRAARLTARGLLTLALIAGVAFAGAGEASATIGPYRQAYGTIYVTDVTPHAAWAGNIENRIQYYRGLSSAWGVHWNVIKGPCRVGYPCVRLSIGTYGRTGWVGETVWANHCSAYTLCTYRGSMYDQRFMTMVMINTSYGQSVGQQLSVGCHELGHALGYLQHSGTDSCMYKDNLRGLPSWPTSTEKNEIRARFANVPLRPGPPPGATYTPNR